MAEVNLMRFDSDGLLIEHDPANDSVTFTQYTVDGGGPVLGANLDMNNGEVQDAGALSFTDPATDGIVLTSGTLIADDIMGVSLENSMDVGAAILFPAISDDADEVDAFAFPQLAGAPTATPSDGSEGHAVWDSTNDVLYVWDGAGWVNTSVASEAQSVDNSYVAATGGVTAGDVVYKNATNDEAAPAQADAAATSKVIGFAVTTAAAAASFDVRSAGIISGLSGLTAGDRMFLDASTAGAITATRPSGSGNIVVQVGYAKNATDLDIQIEIIGKVR